MSTCVQPNVSDPQHGSNSDLSSCNVMIIGPNFTNNGDHYHNYGKEVAIAVIPGLQTLSTLNCSDIGIDVNSYDSPPKSQSHQTNKTCSPMPSMAFKPSFIQIPFGWKRELIDGHVVYYTPTNVCIQSMDKLATYLQSEGTDKTGLECPLHIETAFSFDPSVASKPYDIEVAKSGNQWPKELCNYKRQIIALATYKQYSLQTQQLIAEQQNQTQSQVQPKSEKRKDTEPHRSEPNPGLKQQLATTGNNAEVVSDCVTHSNTPHSTEVFANKFSKHSSVDSIPNPKSIESANKCEPPSGVTPTVIAANCPNLLPQTVDRIHNSCEKQIFVRHPQYVRQTSNCDNHCQYSVPIGSDALREGVHSFCIYDQSVNSGVYSFSTCDSNQMTVQPNENKTSIYLTPQNAANYGQMISYDNPNVNLIQSSHPHVISAEEYRQYSHAFHPPDGLCGAGLTTIPSYIPLSSATANSGAISFNASALPSNAITLNPTYHQTSQDTSHCHPQNNISILPANPPMPPMTVPNVTSVTTSQSDVIPAVGIAPQIINSANTSGAPQVLQFINSVPLTQITANTVTVLQQSPAQEVSVPATTLIIPQLMQSHEHQVVINHAMAPQTAVFPHIATAAGLTAFPNTISIANAIHLPQRTITETLKPSRSRRRKEYPRTNRTHPPTVASILKRADNEKKQKELNDKQKQQKDQNLQTVSDTNEPQCESPQESITQHNVAVQSELVVDSDNYW